MACSWNHTQVLKYMLKCNFNDGNRKNSKQTDFRIRRPFNNNRVVGYFYLWPEDGQMNSTINNFLLISYLISAYFQRGHLQMNFIMGTVWKVTDS